jgi:hypothetical protein
MKTFIKKLGLFLAVSSIFLSVTLPALAATGNGITVGKSVKVVTFTGNVHMAGSDVVVTDNTVEGDLLVAGGNVQVLVPVEGNLLSAGGQVLISENVEGDAFVAGGTVIINGDIGGDLRVFGGQVYLNSTFIGGDLIVGAGKLI